LASSQLATASRLLPPRSGLERSDFVLLPTTTDFPLRPDVSFRGEAEVSRAAESAASVESYLGCVETQKVEKQRE